MSDRYEPVHYGDDGDDGENGDDSSATLATSARTAIDLWAERTTAIGARPEVAYVLVTDAACDPHGQIWAFSTVPPAPLAELNAVPCPTCMEHPDDRLVTEAMGWRAWAAAAGQWPYSVVLAPMGHRPNLASLGAWERDALAHALGDLLGRFATLGLSHFLWVHQQPTDGRAWPNAHVHVEIAAAPPPATAAELGSGVFFNPLPPAAAAAALRDAGEPTVP